MKLADKTEQTKKTEPVDSQQKSPSQEVQSVLPEDFKKKIHELLQSEELEKNPEIEEKILSFFWNLGLLQKNTDESETSKLLEKLNQQLEEISKSGLEAHVEQILTEILQTTCQINQDHQACLERKAEEARGILNRIRNSKNPLMFLVFLAFFGTSPMSTPRTGAESELGMSINFKESNDPELRAEHCFVPNIFIDNSLLGEKHERQVSHNLRLVETLSSDERFHSYIPNKECMLAFLGELNNVLGDIGESEHTVGTEIQIQALHSRIQELISSLRKSDK